MSAQWAGLTLGVVMFRVAVAAVALLLLGALVVVGADGGPWSTDPQPVPVIDLDVPDSAEPGTATTAWPGVSTPASVSAPEVVPPPTVSPEDDDDADEGDAGDDD